MSILQDSGYQPIHNDEPTKGFRYIYKGKEGDILILVQSEFEPNGGIQLKTDEAGNFELSPAWIKNINDKLPDSSNVKQEVQFALEHNLIKTMLFVLTQDGIQLVPVHVPDNKHH